MEIGNYIIISFFVCFLVLFIMSGYLSIPGSQPSTISTSLQNCQGVNLTFNYSAQQTPIRAPINTNTFSVVYVTNDGNVTQNVSISGVATPSLSLIFAKPFLAVIGQKSYTEYEISNPQVIGNYSANMTLTANYANCRTSKSFISKIDVVSNKST